MNDNQVRLHRNGAVCDCIKVSQQGARKRWNAGQGVWMVNKAREGRETPDYIHHDASVKFTETVEQFRYWHCGYGMGNDVTFYVTRDKEGGSHVLK